MPILNISNCRNKKKIVLADNEDISTGISRIIPPFKTWTLYLEVNSRNVIEIEFSPENEVIPNTAKFFGIPESPVRMLDSDSAQISMDYDVGIIRITGSTTAITTAIIRGNL